MLNYIVASDYIVVDWRILLMELLNQLLQTPYDFLKDYGGPFVLVLSILVFVHEWGHYIVARLCGVKVEKFSIGFGPELFGINDRHGTRWKVSLIPLGGYVQMFGDSDPASGHASDVVEQEDGTERPMTEEERKVAFFSQALWKRFAIVFAGPAVNYIFAIFLLTGLFIFHGQPYTPPVAATLVEGTPAEAAGILPDDKIIDINGTPMTRFEDLVQSVSVNLGKEMDVTVLRYLGDDKWDKDNPIHVKITPSVVEVEDRFGFKHSVGRIGVISPPGKTALLEHGPFDAFVAALGETWRLTYLTLKGVKQMITGERSPKELGGILRIGAYAGEFAQAGIISLITFAALLSINLGLINLFPIPLLDGGHLVFYIIEFLKGKPLSPKAQEYALRTGFVFVIGLMLFATWNDLVQLKFFDYIANMIS